ncbi:hypothetical protein C6497_17770 [Candidatus Poribacteria bacterium]|nr:MAG: hypothetical protein C6497_17770 [Candidatus Poribacteria bacterium]
MSLAERISGCYRRVLIFLISILVLGFAAGAFIYNRVGGKEGLHYWTVERALNNIEKSIQDNRPDGISQDTIDSQFQQIRNAIDNRQIDLIILYNTLNIYQEKFQGPGLSVEKVKPSTPEVEEFLIRLQSAILTEDK